MAEKKPLCIYLDTVKELQSGDTLPQDSSKAPLDSPSFTTIVNLAAAIALTFLTRSKISSPADGVLLVTNNAGTDFSMLKIGGTTASFPALKRSTTILQVRLADDSAAGIIQAAAFRGASSGDAVILQDALGNASFRGVRANGWADSVSSGFFQIGVTSDNIIFTAFTAGVANRMLFSSLKTSYTMGSYASTPAPTDAFEWLNTSNVKFLGLTTDGVFNLNRTITAAGTNGAQTINKPAGTINIAAGGTSVVLTNSLITANSIIAVSLRSNDSTAKSVSYVAAAGSCTFYLNAAATAAVSIGFIVYN